MGDVVARVTVHNGGLYKKPLLSSSLVLFNDVPLCISSDSWGFHITVGLS